MNDRHVLPDREDEALQRLMQADSMLDGALLLTLYQSSQPQADFPEALDHRCYALIHRHFHRQHRCRMLVRFGKKVACFVVAVLAAVLLTLSISPSARAAVSQWLSGWDGGLYAYRPTGTDMTTRDYDYAISRLPEGYSLDQSYPMPTGGTICYDNKEEKKNLYLTYCRQEEGSGLFLALTEESHKSVSVHGITADLYYYPDLHDDSSLVWVDPETNYLLHISGYFPEEEMIAIAESIVRTERKECKMG